MIEQSSQIHNPDVSDSSNSQPKKENQTSQPMIKKPAKINGNIEKGQHLQNSQSSSQSIKKPQLCINKICPKNKNSNVKPFNNKLYAFDPNQLCDECMVQYKKQAYCLYCKQIYFDSSDDGKQWILCDECGRWVHSQCANYDPTFDSDFKCIKCKKSQPPQNPINLVKKQSVKPNVKQPERRKLAECSLNAYGFFWQLAPKQLAQDMDKIKQYLN